jgi:hypothetical protein
MIIVKIHDHAGSFAENKDAARVIRKDCILPALGRAEEVVLDFEKVDAVTQSFIHALISDVLREYGVEVLDRIAFKSCNETTRKIVSMVVDYMQEGL